MDKIQPIDTQHILSEAILAAQKWEAELGEPTTGKGASRRKGKAERAFEALQHGMLKVENPQAYLERLRLKDFESMSIPISSDIRKSMNAPDGYRYYKLIAPVLLFPGRGTQYRLVESQFTFNVPQDQRRPGIHSIFPTAEWCPVINWGGDLQLGLDSELNWTVGVDKIKVSAGKLDGEIAGRLVPAAQMSSFIQVGKFVHSLGRMEIEATHTAQTAMWRLDSQRAIRSQGQMQFVTLIKIPKELRQIRLSAAIQVEPNFDWLVAQVHHVLDHLPEALLGIFEKRKGLALQAFEEWKLDLPE